MRYKIYRYLIRAVLLWSVLLGASTTALAADNTLTTLIPFDVKRDLTLFAAGRDLLDIRDFSGPYSRRDVVEVVLFYQALDLGGFKGQVRELMVPEGNYLKVGRMLRQGRTALVANSVWLDAVNTASPEIWVTDALIEDGQFSTGIYARADRAAALKPTLLSQRDNLSAVSSSNWLVDWRELQRLEFRHMYDRNMWPEMVEMVGRGSADVLLAPFQTPLGSGIHLDNHHLLPVPGVKLTLPGSRHWVASKNHPRGKIGFAFLQRGLLKLQQMGRIEQAYRQSGFISEDVESWVELYQPLAGPESEKSGVAANL